MRATSTRQKLWRIFFKDTLRLDIAEESTNFITRLGRRKEQCPILVQFTNFAMK
jgi:hypothetical protein